MERHSHGPPTALGETDQGVRHEILGRLAVGGMAELYTARAIQPDGRVEHVVLKRILPHLAQDPEFIRMFQDEANLAATLHHPNIVRVLQIGQHRGELFFTMEYVHGDNARTIIRAAQESERHIPLQHVIQIALGVTTGLHYAHERHDADGNWLRIVHRDVSPTNVLVSFDGAVKIVDFGIAKAAAATHVTQAGMLKGKASYMSPEQCRADPVDRRSDVYAIGILLYEMTTLSRLYRGESELAILHQILTGKYEKPSVRVAGYPATLEQIIVRCLAQDPANRYQTALEIAQELLSFSASFGLSPSPAALGQFVLELCGDKPYPWAEGASPEELVESSTTSATGSGLFDEQDTRVNRTSDAKTPPTGALPRPEIDDEPPTSALTPSQPRMVAPTATTSNAAMPPAPKAAAPASKVPAVAARASGAPTIATAPTDPAVPERSPTDKHRPIGAGKAGARIKPAPRPGAPARSIGPAPSIRSTAPTAKNASATAPAPGRATMGSAATLPATARERTGASKDASPPREPSGVSPIDRTRDAGAREPSGVSPIGRPSVTPTPTPPPVRRDRAPRPGPLTARQSSKPDPLGEGTAEMLAERGVTLIGSPSPPRSRVTIPAGTVVAKGMTAPPSSTATLPGASIPSSTETIPALQRSTPVSATASGDPTRGTTPAVGTKLVTPTDTTVIAPTDRGPPSPTDAAGSDAAMRTVESSGAHGEAVASQSGVDRTMLMPTQGSSASQTDLMVTQPRVLTEIRPLTPEEQGLLVTQRASTTGGAALLSEPASVAPTRRLPLWIPLLVVLALAAAGAAAVTFLWPRGSTVGVAPATDDARGTPADDASVPARVITDDRSAALPPPDDPASAAADDPNDDAKEAGEHADPGNEADPDAEDADAGQRDASDAEANLAADDAEDRDGPRSDTPDDVAPPTDDASRDPAKPRSSSSSSSKKPRDREKPKRGEPEPQLPGFRPGRPVPP